MKINLSIKYISHLLLLLIAFGCNTNKEDSKIKDNNYKINLFPQTEQEEQSYFLSFEEAYDKSNAVVITDIISLVDSSTSSRGNKEFFIYYMERGRYIKTPTNEKIDKFQPIYFVTDNKLFFFNRKQDSIYVFLDKLMNKKIIRSQMNISNKWLKHAPELAKQRE